MSARTSAVEGRTPAQLYSLVFGAVLVLVGIVGFIDPRGFGLLTHPWTVVDNIIHLLLGLLGIAVGFLLDRDTTVTVR